VRVTVAGGRLTVDGQRRREQHRKHTARWNTVSIHRVIPLPTEADPDRIEATVEGHALKIHLHRRKP